jgi:hypothetical protein
MVLGSSYNVTEARSGFETLGRRPRSGCLRPKAALPLLADAHRIAVVAAPCI